MLHYSGSGLLKQSLHDRFFSNVVPYLSPHFVSCCKYHIHNVVNKTKKNNHSISGGALYCHWSFSLNILQLRH